jgi:pimeloyl-[acyl-carrier protein] methyl ester esterase
MAATQRRCASSPPIWKPTTTPRLERFIALEAMGSPDPRAELRHLRTLVFARGEPDLRVLQEGIRILEDGDCAPRCLTWPCPARGSPAAAIGWCPRRRCSGRPAMRRQLHEIEHAGHAPFFGHVDALAEALQPLLLERLAQDTAP